MTVSSIASSVGPSIATQAGTGLAKNFDSFLTLLTAQLRNQDPLQPLDSKDFTQQLVQFTGVEQSINTNKSLEQMLTLFRGATAASAVAYIGKTIEADSSISSFSGGKAGWSYDLPRAAARTVLTINDMDGKQVTQIAGDIAAGSHTFVWDGKNSSGLIVPDGLYQLNIAAIDNLGNAIKVDTSVIGTVTGIESANGEQILLVGESKVRLSDIRSVTSPAN